MDHKRRSHGQDGAETGQGHVLLGIPHIALGAKVGHAQLTLEVDEEVEQFIVARGARPAFKGYRGFPATVCVSINEEIVRLGAHLSSFRATLGHGIAVGKKLDFICQEMHREINTIGSKSTTLPVSTAVVEAKDALENLREQLRNVE